MRGRGAVEMQKSQEQARIADEASVFTREEEASAEAQRKADDFVLFIHTRMRPY